MKQIRFNVGAFVRECRCYGVWFTTWKVLRYWRTHGLWDRNV